MNKIALFFLFVYTLTALRLWGPLLAYEIHYDYINAQLCENRALPNSVCKGKCYLQKQLKLQNPTAPATAPRFLLAISDLTPHLLAQTLNILWPGGSPRPNEGFCLIEKTLPPFCQILRPPPRSVYAPLFFKL